MEPSEYIAFLTLMIGIVIFIAIFAEGYNRRLKHKERMLELEVRRVEALASTQGSIDVEDRLRVLERIATDPAQRLSQAIENLRPSERETAQ